MFGLTRWNSFDDVFNFQREVDRLFNQFWSDLPTHTATATGPSPSFHVKRMYRQLMNGTSRPFRRFSSTAAVMLAIAFLKSPRWRYFT